MKRLMAIIGAGVFVAAMLGVGCSKDDSNKQVAKHRKTKTAKNDKPGQKPGQTTNVNTAKQVTLTISGMT